MYKYMYIKSDKLSAKPKTNYNSKNQTCIRNA